MSLARHTGAHHIFLTSVAAIVAASPLTSLADPEAQAVLLKAVDAMSLAHAVQFTSTMQTEIPFGGSVLKTSGSSQVIMKRDMNAGLRWRVHHQGKAKAGMIPPVAGVSDADVEFLIVDLNATVLWIDHKQKKVIEVFYRSARNEQVQMANATWMSNLKAADPFEIELAAQESKLEARQTVEGVLCDVVLINMGENKDQRRWYFGAEDHLPRKKETINAATAGKSGEGVVETITVKDLKLNPDVPETIFSIVPPEGYTEQLLPKPGVQNAPGSDAGNGGEGDGADLPVQPRDANTFPAIPFDEMDLNGKQIAFDQMQNQTIVLYFFASWNPTAKDATAAMEEMAKKYKDQPVKIIGFAVRERSEQHLRDFVTSSGASFPIVYLKDDRIFRAYRGTSYPFFTVVGSNGSVIHAATGYRADETVPSITEKIDMSIKGEFSNEQLPALDVGPGAFQGQGRGGGE